MYSTYIIYSQIKDKFYIGQCQNIGVRLSQHNAGRNVSTKSGIPWKLIYVLSFDSRTEAVGLELKIKKRGARRFLSDNNIDVS